MATEILIGILIFLQLVTAVEVWRRGPASQPKPAATPPPPPAISAQAQSQLEVAARAAFETAVKAGTDQFGRDLADTSAKLNQLIMRLTADVVERELEAYRKGLSDARARALASMQKMQAAIEQRQASLETDVDSEMTKRRQYLAERLDKKLGEAVSAYIVESLGQGADLGAQRSFLFDSLERHKEAIKQDLTGGKN